MRTKQEFDEAFTKVGGLLDQVNVEDDETLQAIYETLKWANGDSDWENTVAQHLPS